MTFAEDKLLTRTAPVGQHTKLPTIHAIVTSDYFQIAKIDLKGLPVIQTPNSPFYCCRLPQSITWSIQSRLSQHARQSRSTAAVHAKNYSHSGWKQTRARQLENQIKFP